MPSDSLSEKRYVGLQLGDYSLWNQQCWRVQGLGITQFVLQIFVQQQIPIKARSILTRFSESLCQNISLQRTVAFLSWPTPLAARV